MNLHDFLEMGGYAAYVWPAYGLSLVILVGTAWLSRLRHKRRIVELEHRARAVAEEERV